MDIKHIKFCFIGDAYSGKTSLVKRIVSDEYLEKSPTIGCAYENKLVIKDGKSYKLDIWDTAGQERYAELVPIYFRNNDVFILCFDLSIEDSLSSIAKWLDKITKWCINLDPVICLVGTKCDIKDIPDDKLRALKEKFQFFYCETSSKENIGIDELLEWTIEEAIKRHSYKTYITTPQYLPPATKSRCFFF